MGLAGPSSAKHAATAPNRCRGRGWPPTIARRVGAVEAEMITRFGRDEHDGDRDRPPSSAPAGRRRCATGCAQLSPVGQYVARHSRETLRSYRRTRSNSARTSPSAMSSPIVIPFDAEEQRLYDELDELIDRLMRSPRHPPGRRVRADRLSASAHQQLGRDPQDAPPSPGQRGEPCLDQDLLDEAERGRPGHRHSGAPSTTPTPFR